MTYRDDLEAAREQIERLQQELEEARGEVALLKKPPTPAEVPIPSTPEPRARRLARGVYYDPPRTYFPLLLLVRAGALAAWHRMPKASPELDSNNLLVIVAYRLFLWPFVNFVWRPVYVACLGLILLPWAGAIALVLSVPLLLVIALARLRVGTPTPNPGEGWPQGDVGEQEGAMAFWILLSITMAPLLVVFIPLLKDDD